MIGTYYRLSLADEDVGADKAESNSIQGQRGLVERYIMARPELAAEPRQEYVDDGYSGTSTSRPAFQRLIQDAQDGKLKTIIVKDFSRFARDYIEAGDYMERIFPLLGVRFISVNDGYDSGMQIGNDVRGLEVAITKETEAESIAFTVCSALGIDTSDYSFPYVASWASGKELKELKDSMDTIRLTAADFLEKLETAVAERSVERMTAMEYAEKLIADKERDKTVFDNSQRNLIVNFAYKLDDRAATEELANNLAAVVAAENTEEINRLMWEAEEKIESLPDGMIGLSEMHESVLDKLRIRQMAREKQKSSQEQSADMERNRK